MNNVIGTIYSSRNFTYLKDSKIFVGEISELREVLRQLWNDSMDLGFGIRSEKSGRVVLFTLKNIKRDEDNDILQWEFEVYNPNNSPILQGLTATILND
jgi:hypothetical protein